MRKLRVKLFQDGKIHEYKEDVAERLEASNRCKILGVVGARPVKLESEDNSKKKGKNNK